MSRCLTREVEDEATTPTDGKKDVSRHIGRLVKLERPSLDDETLFIDKVKDIICHDLSRIQ